MMNNNYVVYKHTSPSNKVYIGITNNYSKRCKQHQWLAAKEEGFAFHAAIRKYEWSKFKRAGSHRTCSTAKTTHPLIVSAKY